MTKSTYAYIFLFLLATLAGCRGGNNDDRRSARRAADTLYTVDHALHVYDYQPAWALTILDSAVAKGNISAWEADYFRAKFYAWTVMDAQVDSLLPGPEGVRFDSARAAGERFLAHDSVAANLRKQQDVLEVLLSVARHSRDTARFLVRAQQLVDVCLAQGNETEALRTEAELGVALYWRGQREEGMARLDSVIAMLDTRESRRFNELDAMIIARKRKIVLLNEEKKYIESIPQARRIIDRLDDYEQHPSLYHDGSYREPKDSTERANYIDFYRTQAQSAITAAYAFLGEQGSMNESYAQIERSVREATAKEHIARYNALEQQMRRAEAEHHSRLMTTIAVASLVGLLIILIFAAYIYGQSRRIRRKNRVLVKLIEETAQAAPSPALLSEEGKGKEAEGAEGAAPTGAEGEAISAESEEEEAANRELFAHIDATIRTERLYANINMQRNDICERFQIRRVQLNLLFARYAGGQSFSVYINTMRLNEACRLLREDAEITVNSIAEKVGLSPRNLRRLFVEQFGMTPTEYRQGL